MDDAPRPRGERVAGRRGARGGAGDGADGRGFAPREDATPEQLEARAKLRELMSQGPSFEDTARRVGEVLTPAQREHLESVRSRAGQRRPDGSGRGAGRGEGRNAPEGAPRSRRQRPERTPDNAMPNDEI